MARNVNAVNINVQPPVVTPATVEYPTPEDGAEVEYHTHADFVAGGHPDLATHDALGLATDAELAGHVAALDPHAVYALDNDVTAPDYLVATASSYLQNEIAVGTTPGGELGGTWASPTVDATHSGSAHVALTGSAPVAIGTAAVGVAATSAHGDHVHATGAGTPSTQAFGDAAAIGSGPAAAMTDHKHAMPSERAASSTTPSAIGTAAVGTGVTDARADHVHATGAGTPVTQAFGDAAAIGTGPAAAMTNHVHGMPANPVAYAAPALTLGTANSAGVAASAVRTDATILAFDATTPAAVGTAAVGAATVAARRDHVHATGAGTPSTQAMGDAAATGSGPAAAMTDHKHAMPALGTTTVAVGTAAGGSAVTPSKSDHVHATGAGTPTNSTEGDAAAVGTGPAAAMTDHKHGRVTATRKYFLAAALAKLDSATAANVGASPQLTGVVAYADAATQGALWTFMVPSDWVSGAISIAPIWSPGATDGVSHTVRWSVTAQTVAAGVTVTASGTTTAFTGTSAARTIGVVVYETATSTTLTPAAAGDLFRFTLQRIGADAADTYVGVVNLLGVIVSYTANT